MTRPRYVVGGDQYLEWCDRHQAYVAEGSTQPYAPGSTYRMCNRCAKASQDVSHLFHEVCGFAWDVHDNTVQGNALPFGCPSESAARSIYGDR